MILYSGIYNKELYLKRNIIKELYDKGLSKKDAGLWGEYFSFYNIFS